MTSPNDTLPNVPPPLPAEGTAALVDQPGDWRPVDQAKICNKAFGVQPQQSSSLRLSPAGPQSDLLLQECEE